MVIVNIRCSIAVFLLSNLLLINNLFGQNSISGSVTIADKVSPLAGAVVIVFEQADTTSFQTTLSDSIGRFNIKTPTYGAKILRVEYLGFQTYRKELISNDSLYDVGVIVMQEDYFTLDTVLIQGKQQLSQQRGDTTEFNAAAYKTNPDANAQDLISKMPGITFENGAVKAQGENIGKVTLDGKEFFGEDATIALRNLPAEIIDKIQVFDRGNDQSSFTGFDDGNTQKSLNIVTRPGRNAGEFGRVFGGYGTSNRYMAGGNLNTFSAKRRITILGLANNINQQNFASQDLTGINASGNQNRGAGGQGNNRGNPGGQGGAGNFNVSQQSGITTTQSAGINYQESWGKKMDVSGSYFLNNSINSNQNYKRRDYLLSRNEQVYNENSNSSNHNLAHRLNARIDFKFDTMNSLLINPRLVIQDVNIDRRLSAKNVISDSTVQSTTDNITDQKSVVFQFSNNILFRHKFLKKGRTISLDVNTDYSNRDGNTLLNSSNNYFSGNDSSSQNNQRTVIENGSKVLGANLNFTEAIGSNGLLQFTYSPSINQNESSRIANIFDENNNSYSIFNPQLSSGFSSTIGTQRGGISYRLRNQKYNVSIGTSIQAVELDGKQDFPTPFIVQKNFNSLLPNAMLQYRFSKSNNLRIFYRTSTSTPSVNQLQPVVDNTNPLQLNTGNPDLKQEYTHFGTLRYNSNRTSAASTFMVLLRASLTNNYIGNSIFIAERDTILLGYVNLQDGSQLIQPVNLNGNLSISSFANYSIPLLFIKSNINFNGGIGYNKIPGVVNRLLNISDNYTLNTGIVLSSNINEKIDFTISYSGNINSVKYRLQGSLNSTYYNHFASIKFYYNVWKGLVIYSDVSNSVYSGLGATFDRNFYLWNPSLGYKFGKTRSTEFRISAFDLLNQNTSISRNINANFIEDNSNVVLRRYFMVSLIYNFKSFIKESKVRAED